MRAPVAAVPVDEVFACDIPGAFKFYLVEGKVGGLTFVCPCGCGALYGVSFPSWTWDGNRDKPTVDPSVRALTDCRFHGHLHNGVFTFCEDSGTEQP